MAKITKALVRDLTEQYSSVKPYRNGVAISNDNGNTLYITVDSQGYKVEGYSIKKYKYTVFYSKKLDTVTYGLTAKQVRKLLIKK